MYNLYMVVKENGEWRVRNIQMSTKKHESIVRLKTFLMNTAAWSHRTAG